jgi:hypothetical protein
LRPWHRQSGSSEVGVSVLELSGIPIDPEMADKFRTAFAFDEKEPLLGCRSFTSLFVEVFILMGWLQTFKDTYSVCYLYTAGCMYLPIISASSPAVP